MSRSALTTRAGTNAAEKEKYKYLGIQKKITDEAEWRLR